MLPSLNAPVAVNCWVVPSAIEAVPGVTVIETRAAGVIVRFALPLIALEVAVTSAVPSPVLVASPPALTVNTVVSLEVHLAVFVRSCVVPPVYVPKAVNCCFVPSAAEALEGDTASVTSAAGVTVRVLEPVTDDDVAVITVCPVPTLVARPLVTGALLTVATAVLLEFHVTVALMSCVVPSV